MIVTATVWHIIERSTLVAMILGACTFRNNVLIINLHLDEYYSFSIHSIQFFKSFEKTEWYSNVFDSYVYSASASKSATRLSIITSAEMYCILQDRIGCPAYGK